MTTGPAVDKHRMTELDGIRGWASLSVLLYHVFWEIFGNAIPGFRNALTASLFDGTLAVAVFFVLSGEALSVGYWQTRRLDLVKKMAIKRYPRLTIPIFFACLMAYVLMKCHLVYAAQAAPVVKSENWLGTFLHFEPSVPGLVRHALLDVYVHHRPSSSYGPFLWTMKVELLGSLLVFLLLALKLKESAKLGLITFTGLLLLVTQDFTACFMLGVGMGYFRSTTYFRRWVSGKAFQRLSIPLLLLLLLLGGIPQLTGVSGHSGYKPFYTLVAAAIVCVAQESSIISAGLRSAPSIFLGKISFPLYLTQFPVFISATSYAIVHASRHGEQLDTGTVAAISIMTIVLSLMVATLFGRVEKWAHIASEKCALWIGGLTLPPPIPPG